MYRDKMIWLYVKGKQVLSDIRGEFGVGSILSIAVALIVSAFVLVPGMKGFADKIILDMKTWWNDTITKEIFPKTSPTVEETAINIIKNLRGING